MSAWVVALIVLVFPSTATDLLADQSKPDVSRRAQALQEEFQEIDTLVRQGKLKKAKRRAGSFSRTLVDSVDGSLGSGRVLAHLAMLRALAHLGLGEDREAQWFWDVAWAVHPLGVQLDPRPYGEVGERLAEMVPRQYALDLEASLPEGALAPPEDEVVVPKIRKKPAPRYPRGMRTLQREEVVRVHVVIDEAGQVHAPEVEQAGQHAAFVYAAFEAVRDWEIEPARHRGVPIRVDYYLDVTFELRKD